MKRILIFMILALVFSSCSKVEEKPLVISTDVWIGATPLYYAHAMGWLKEINIRMLQADSIEENLNLFAANASDVVTGTEHEYQRLKRTYPDLVPVIVYDRSYGADVVLSNRTIQQLKESSEEIDVYVELDTVSEDMLDYFCAEHNLARSKMNIYSRHQSEIEMVQNNPASSPTVIITYNPHDLILIKRGFKEVASSKNDSYFVADTMMMKAQLFPEHKEQLKKLQTVLGRAIAAYHKDPKAFYTTVKPYIENPTYAEFDLMLKNIRWINNRDIPAMMVKKMDETHFPTGYLVDFEGQK